MTSAATSSRAVDRARGYLRAVGAVVWKDLAAELRSRELLSGMLVFALLVILIFNFALELDLATRQTVTSGVLWVTFAFAGTLGLNRSMAVERDRGCLDGLLLAPVDRSALYFGKALGNLAFMLIVEAIVLPAYSSCTTSTCSSPGWSGWCCWARSATPPLGRCWRRWPSRLAPATCCCRSCCSRSCCRC